MRWLDRTLLVSCYDMCLCLTQKSFDKVMRSLGEAPSAYLREGSDATVHFVNAKEKQTAVVCLGSLKKKTGAQVQALVVHEALHIWQEFKRAMGEETVGDETEAYCVQALVQTLLTEYERQVSQPARKSKQRRK